MTHDELLAKIIGVSIDVFNTFPELIDDNLTRNVKALRAVVELHKPEIRRNNKPFCAVCYEEGQPYEQANDVYYPCPTIQAIQKELENGI